MPSADTFEAHTEYGTLAVLGWCGGSSSGGTAALAGCELRKSMLGGVPQSCKYQTHSQKVIYRKVQVCCLRVVFVMALTPCNGLGGEEKRVRIAKWIVGKVEETGDLGGTGCASDSQQEID